VNAAVSPPSCDWQHAPGRPTGLTPGLADGIRSLILAGTSIRRAALRLGVPATTFERWRDRARRGRKPYADHFKAFEIAETVFLAGIEQTLTASTRDDWRAAAWLLSKRLPAEYGDAKQVTRSLERIPDDHWAAIVATYGGDPNTANFEADMRMLIEAKQKAADKAEFDRLPHDQQRALIKAEMERRGLPTKILIEDCDD
jgi:hypothetical protein